MSTTTKTDRRPWAFDDSPQWKAFRTACERAGLQLRVLAEWPPEPGAKCRGAAVAKYAIYYGNRGVLVTRIIAEGFGPDGFALYQFSDELELIGDVNALVARGKAIEAKDV